jgi:hypothetical protein
MIEIGRRLFLGGAAALIGLPWLESVARASSSAKRFLVFYVPNGVQPGDWIPSVTGTDFDLPPALVSLAPHRSSVSVISGLANPAADQDDGHLCGTASLLTCRPVPIEEERIKNGVSVDQLAAQSLGPSTRFASLQLGLEPGLSVGGCGVTASCAYGNTISWAGETAPLPVMIDARVVFERLFSGIDAGESARAVLARRRRKKSVLDFVREDARALETRIAARDRERVEEYLTGLRELEQRIDAGGKIGECAIEDPGVLQNEQTEQRVRAMGDLMVAAFQCDLTRIITFMLASSASGRAYRFLGVEDGHHEMSHHDDKPERLSALRAIATWEVAQFGYLIDRLSRIDEGEGSALDNSILIFSSEISDGNKHDHVDIPMIVAGRGGGAIASGRHLRFEKEPLANLHLTVLQALGVGATSFGIDGTRPLELT